MAEEKNAKKKDQNQEAQDMGQDQAESEQQPFYEGLGQEIDQTPPPNSDDSDLEESL